MSSTTNELWADLRGFPGYKISSFGRIYSTKTNRYLKAKPNIVNGYLQLCINGKGIRLHRAVAEHFLPNPHNLPCVNHIDSNRQNPCVSNLEWVTEKQNAAHRLLAKFFTFEGTTPNIETVNGSI